MIPVYHDGSTAYSMVGGAGSSAYQAPSGVLSGTGNMNEDLRNNAGSTQWFNANKIGRYVTTNTNAATFPFEISKPPLMLSFCAKPEGGDESIRISYGFCNIVYD